jgi:hypothetical protein
VFIFNIPMLSLDNTGLLVSGPNIFKFKIYELFKLKSLD